jgi:hypothetical protein
MLAASVFLREFNCRLFLTVPDQKVAYHGRDRVRSSWALLEYASKRALNSAVECHPHTVEVIGSNPIAPTIFSTIYPDSRSVSADASSTISKGAVLISAVRRFSCTAKALNFSGQARDSTRV